MSEPQKYYIQVNEDYRIYYDGSFVLEHRFLSNKTDGTKAYKWDVTGFYGNVMQCLYKVLSLTEIKPQDTVSDYYERFNEMYQYLYIEKFGEITKKVKGMQNEK